MRDGEGLPATSNDRAVMVVVPSAVRTTLALLPFTTVVPCDWAPATEYSMRATPEPASAAPMRTVVGVGTGPGVGSNGSGSRLTADGGTAGSVGQYRP